MLAEKPSTLAKNDSSDPGGESGIDELVHDLRGPLSVIVAFAESLEGAEREERARFTERLVVNAHRALSVLEEFAALSDLRSDVVEMKIRPMDLAEVTKRATDEVAAGLRGGLKVNCLVPTDGVPMMGDRDLVGMAVRALLRKAATGLDTPASLRVHVTADNDLARVEIRASTDGGPRCALDDLNGGELEILRRVAVLHGGRVVFENDDPGPSVGFCVPRQPR